MPRKVVLHHPGRGFRTVSVTGRACSLQCEHCRGRYLGSMIDTSVKGSLVAIGEDLICKGVKGVLVSGGCLSDGSVPLRERVDEVRELKRMGLYVNVHTGLLDDDGAREIASTGADSYSIDMHSSAGVIRNVLHLKAVPDDYVSTLRSICAAAPGKVSPHICAGLEGDTITNEKRSVDNVKGEEIASIVLLRHIKTKGAPHDPRPSLSDERFLELVEYAVGSGRPVMLGCMRPRPSQELEVASAELGVSGIASPSSSTKKRLEALGFQVEESELCCSVHR